jgi:nitronate monooxygenase
MNSLYDFLNQACPIIQAPMAGGATTPELIAAVCNTGGLGSLGAGYMQPDDLRQAILKIRQLTNRPFLVNLFIVKPIQVDVQAMLTACEAVRSCAQVLSKVVQPVEAPFAPIFEEQLAVCFEQCVPLISFTFGLPDKTIIEKCHQHNMQTMGTATTLEEAQACAALGMDAVVLQGEEAGGHRASFLKSALDSLVPLKDLLKQCKASIACPLLASGGIMNAEDVQYYLSLGASAVQMGTAFLCTHEAGIPQCYKLALLEQTEDNTVLTHAFSGAYARGIKNQFTQCMHQHEDAVLPYPAQNRLTKAMRDEAKAQEKTAFMSLWAGQSVAKARYQSVAGLMRSLVND